MTLKTISVRTLISIGTAAAAALAVCLELWIGSAARTLKDSIAERERMTRQYAAREKSLAERIGILTEEKYKIDELPAVLLQNEDELRAAVGQCAAAAGVRCSISVQGAENGNVLLSISVRFSDAGLKRFLAELLARRELFSIERLEYEGFSGSSAAAVIYLNAFLKAEIR